MEKLDLQAFKDIGFEGEKQLINIAHVVTRKGLHGREFREPGTTGNE